MQSRQIRRSGCCPAGGGCSRGTLLELGKAVKYFIWIRIEKAKIYRHGRALVPNVQLFREFHGEVHQISFALIQVSPLGPRKPVLADNNIFNCDKFNAG